MMSFTKSKGLWMEYAWDKRRSLGPTSLLPVNKVALKAYILYIVQLFPMVIVILLTMDVQ